MRATRDYLHTKQAMDALRNEWHAKVAATSDAWLKYRTRILANMDKALKVAARRAERAHRQEMQRIAVEGLSGTERDVDVSSIPALTAAE